MSASGPPRDQVVESLQELVDREGGAPPDWPAKIERFLGLLALRNQSINLISRATAEESLERHVVPSLAALLLVAPGAPLRVLDVGSGGGFPGIPLALLRPEARVDLVDATRKKCEFLGECVSTLGIENVRVHWCRIEQAPESLRSRAPFDVALARAVGAPERLAQATQGLLAPGGKLWVFGKPGEDEGLPWRDARGRVVTVLKEVRGT